MEKENYAPVLIVLLSIAFVIICLLVFVTGNRFSGLISKKMKLGALIIALSGAALTGKAQEITCYIEVRPPQEDISFTGNPEGVLQSFSDTTDIKLNITIESPQNANYSYIDVGKLKPGEYTLYIYRGPIDKIQIGDHKEMIPFSVSYTEE